MSWGGRGEKIKRTRTDIIFSEYVRERDHWKCVKCDKQFIQGVDSRKLHCAHIWFGRANINTRWEPLNCLSLCIGCHLKVDQSPADAYEILCKFRTPDEIFWLQQQRDIKRTIKIPKDKDLEAREVVKKLLYNLKKERGTNAKQCNDK